MVRKGRSGVAFARRKEEGGRRKKEGRKKVEGRRKT